MSNKLTIIKVLPKGEDLSPSNEDLKRWHNIFANHEMTLERAAETGEVKIEQVDAPDENTITLVKVGDPNYTPTFEDLEAWRKVFEEASNDQDFKIFTHPGVEVEMIPVGKIVAVE